MSHSRWHAPYARWLRNRHSQLAQVALSLLDADKGRGDTCIDDRPGCDGAEPDHRPDVFVGQLHRVLQCTVLPGMRGRKRLVEDDDEIIPEIGRHAAAVARSISDDL